MPSPRKSYLESTGPRCYQLISRCARGAFLTGIDPVTGNDYSHRKRHLQQRLHELDRVFAVEILGFAIHQDRFELVVYYDPEACWRWPAEEVAQRWLCAHPPRARKRQTREQVYDRAVQAMLQNPDLLERRRARLGSLSAFMSCLKQPIARQANREDQYCGRFFIQDVKTKTVALN